MIDSISDTFRSRFIVWQLSDAERIPQQRSTMACKKSVQRNLYVLESHDHITGAHDGILYRQIFE